MMKMASHVSSPWPDPNSPILTKIDFGVPLVELFKWLDVRDMLLGRNERKQDITSALALARDCKHPDAVWLTSVFEGKDVSTKEEANQVFLSSGDDGRGLCFAWCLSNDRETDFSLLCRAAEMGLAFACSTLCDHRWRTNKAHTFRLAQQAARQKERDGLYWLGRCLRFGVGCEKDMSLGMENYKVAAELGHVYAGETYGFLLDEFDPHRWMWLSRVALRGLPMVFLANFSDRLLSSSSIGSISIVFLIGRALKGNIDMEKKGIFGNTKNFDSLIGPANQAVSFYDSQIKFARLVVDTWTLVGIRLGVVKDIRTLIGKMIWGKLFSL